MHVSRDGLYYVSDMDTYRECIPRESSMYCVSHVGYKHRIHVGFIWDTLAIRIANVFGRIPLVFCCIECIPNLGCGDARIVVCIAWIHVSHMYRVHRDPHRACDTW